MNKPFLSVIIPAYNEAKRLPLTLIDVDKNLSKEDYSYEILVVDDGSTDATAELTRRFIPLIKNLKLITQAKNLGKGAAVRLGMREAKGTIRLFLDADNSVSVSQFNKMLPPFKEGYEAVIGSRNVRGAVLLPPQPIHRRVLGRLGSLWVRALLLPDISDSQCGFKAFTEEAAAKFFPLGRIDRWGFDIELLALAKQEGVKVKEVPVAWSDNYFSHVSVIDYPKVLWETLKIRWWISRGEYPNNQSLSH